MRYEWIVVASREEVRIFSRRGVGNLELITDIGNPNGVLRTRDLESDRHGRASDNRMHARHAYSTQESAKDRSLKDFYRGIIDILDRGLLEHRFDYLTLIAEPRLLGIVRALLSPRLVAVLHREIAKDLSYHEANEILARIS